jgi:GWxTD domain-containing protein
VLNPILYFYFEIYNNNKIETDSIAIDYSIIGMDGKHFREVSTSMLNTGSSMTVFHGINVSNIPSGIYDLVIDINENGIEQKISKSERFEIIQPDYLTLVSNSDNTFEISDNISEYIMTVEQHNKYEKLNGNLKVKYLEKFWKENDPTPLTDENEYFQSIISRYNYVQENYSWAGIDGWKSDRGRVVIKYGIPDDVNRNLFEENTLPYEIWIYRQDREFNFVFCDLRSDGRYALLHSTKEGEIYNPDWFAQVKK